MWIKPSTLVAATIALGAVMLAVVLAFSGLLGARYRWPILGGVLVGWYVLTIWLILPVAVIAQSVRNKRHGVFSHLRRSSTKELETVSR